MQAIETKYLGPTNHKGARIKATAQARSVTVSWDYSANTERSHDAGALALIRKLGWFGTWVRGWKADGTGCVYVCLRRAGHVGFKTPHPLAVSPFDYINVHEDGSVS